MQRPDFFEKLFGVYFYLTHHGCRVSKLYILIVCRMDKKTKVLFRLPKTQTNKLKYFTKSSSPVILFFRLNSLNFIWIEMAICSTGRE
jgi:hypothetical protein